LDVENVVQPAKFPDSKSVVVRTSAETPTFPSPKHRKKQKPHRRILFGGESFVEDKVRVPFKPTTFSGFHGFFSNWMPDMIKAC
jgi:hypothetical protein